MRVLLSLGVILCLSSFSEARDSATNTPTSAAGDNGIKIWCSDGSFYRGDPLEIVPKDHVTLQLHNGKAVRIEWSKITGVDGLKPVPTDARTNQTSRLTEDEEIERAPTLNQRRPSPISNPIPATTTTNPVVSLPTAPAPEPIRSEAEPVVSMAYATGTRPVQLRFTGMRDGARIEYIASSAEVTGLQWPVLSEMRAEIWVPVCELPCRISADPLRQYRVAGPKITTSSSFVLPTRGERFEIAIQPGLRSMRTAAWILLTLGGSLAVGSVGTFLGYDSNKPEKNWLIGGGILLGTGVVALFVGGPLMAKSSTGVEIYRE